MNIGQIAQGLAEASPAEILDTAVDFFGDGLTFATGFGVEGCVLLDLIARGGHRVDVFTLDTGLLFPQTYELWRRLEERYGLTIRAVRPAQTVDEQEQAHGPRLWSRDPDRCCALRKVEPLQRAIAGRSAWLSGVRRDQTRDRSAIQPVEWDVRFSLVKVSPLWRWTERDVWRHVHDHDVPYNPLHNEGYPSIGCAPCTGPVNAGEDPRAGRWRGQPKKECGLHSLSSPKLVEHREEP